MINADNFIPLEDFDDYIFTIEKFRELIRYGVFIDCGGSGHFATETHKLGNVFVKPSTFEDQYLNNLWATHVVWYYNK